MTFLSKLIAFIPCWVMYSAGSFYSMMLRLWDGKYWSAFWYTLYNDCMLDSYYLQSWCDGHGVLWPWED